MPQVHYKTRDEAFEQLNRIVGRWIDENGGEDTYEWMGGHNFMIHRVGSGASQGLEIIGYDEATGQLKSHFYASDRDMLDNGGRPITYIYNFQNEDYEVALDGMPDRHGSFVGELTDNDTVITGEWDWIQNGEHMGYKAITRKQ